MSTVNIKQLRNNVYDTRYSFYVDTYTNFPALEQTGSAARPFQTIQQAVNAVSDGYSWKIYLSNGIYNENITIDNNANLIFIGISPFDTIINGNIDWLSSPNLRLRLVNLRCNDITAVNSLGVYYLRIDDSSVGSINSTSSSFYLTVSASQTAEIDQISNDPLSVVRGAINTGGSLIATNTKFEQQVAVWTFHADGCAMAADINIYGGKAEINNTVWLTDQNIIFYQNLGGTVYLDGVSDFNFTSVGGTVTDGTIVVRASSAFTAGGDLTGNSTSQNIANLQGVPLDTSNPTDGYSLVYSAGSGSIVFKSVSSSGGGGTGITATDHESLRQLIHFIPDGPGKGFPSGSYKETLPSGSIFPTSVIWYTDSGKTAKIFSIDLSYNDNSTINQVTYKVYSSNGITVIETAVDTISYINGIFEATVNRVIS